MTLIAAFVVAALGATLVFLYVQGVDDRAATDTVPVEVLTAVTQIETGESVADAQAAGKFALTEVPGTAVLPGALTDTQSIRDTVALAPVFVGEQIIATRFGAANTPLRITIPDDQMAVSVQLGDPQRVAGFVAPGSQVAIFATVGGACGSAGGTAEMTTRLLLPDVTVIGVGQTGEAETTTTTATTGEQVVEAIPATILTLALDQSDSERVILAAQTSCLALGLLTENSRVTPSAGTTDSDLFTGN